MILLAVATMISVSFAMIGLSKLETSYTGNEVGTAANDILRAHVAAELADAYVQSSSKLAAETALDNTLKTFGRDCATTKPIKITIDGRDYSVPIWNAACVSPHLFWQAIEKSFEDQFEISLRAYNRVGSTFGNPIVLKSDAYVYSAYPVKDSVEI